MDMANDAIYRDVEKWSQPYYNSTTTWSSSSPTLSIDCAADAPVSVSYSVGDWK